LILLWYGGGAQVFGWQVYREWLGVGRKEAGGDLISAEKVDQGEESSPRALKRNHI
jgi:hypothetical protein